MKTKIAIIVLLTLSLVGVISYTSLQKSPFVPNEQVQSSDHMETAREEMALSRGLPADAAWKDITDHDMETARKKTALSRGLPADATWKDINNY